MKVESRNSRTERQLIIATITDKTFCGRVAALKDPETMFSSRHGRLLVSWAVQHYRKYHKPPGRAVEGYFDRWSASGRDEAVVRNVEKFLTGLSKEYERKGTAPSADYLLDTAAVHFNKVRVRDFKEQVEGLLEEDKVDEALKLVEEFRRVEVGVGTGVKLLEDREAVKSAFSSSREVLMRWGQLALDTFFQDSFERDSFIVFEGKEKVGKSFWLQEISWLGMTQERNVAFFEVGDQSQSQLIRRYAARASNRPFKESTLVRVPVQLDPADENPGVEYEERSYDRPLTYKEAYKAFAAAQEKYGADRLRLSVHPNSSISVLGIEQILDRWADEGWVASVVVIDYLDILAPINGKDETRDQINATWKALRRLNQKYHCCLVGATQADSASYSVDTLTRKNFSEDKRKLSHVTGMVGINQTDDEKERQLYRLNWIVGRDLEFSERKCVYTASCLALANPCLLSCFS